MKTLHCLSVGWLCILVVGAWGQNVSSRTNPFEVDYTDPTKVVSTTVPVISWLTPLAENTFSSENKYTIKLEVESAVPLKAITIQIKDGTQAQVRGTQLITPSADQLNRTTVEKSLTLLDGDNVVEIVAENSDGAKTVSQRIIKVGSSSLEDAAKLDRTDYALIFVTDRYDNWPNLVNPVFDGRTIGQELSTNYGFKAEIIENATQSEILKKLREYAEKKYKPLDELFVFFAGHGHYDETFGEGFVVTRESRANDEARTSYLSHNRLRSIVNNIPCEHIFLAMDVCFGGTFDASLASSRALEEPYKEQGQAEFITRKLTYKTRKYLTSGGKEYVSDGIAGQHSPFAKALLTALRERGGRDGILTLPELVSYVDRLKPVPRFGEFGDNAPGSDFVFVTQ